MKQVTRGWLPVLGKKPAYGEFFLAHVNKVNYRMYW